MGEGVESFAKEECKEEGQVMETPDRGRNSQIATSVAKFEESPVFNFLNSLSPIKPVKSIHITQTINPLSFASLPTVFTSPHHVNSLRESRFLQRDELSDPSKPEFCCDAEGDAEVGNVAMDAAKQLDENRIDQNTVELNQINQEKGASSCEWKNALSDASDLIIFESPNETNSYEKSIDPGASFYASIKNDMESMHSLLDSGEQLGAECELEHLATQSGEGIEATQNAEPCDMIAGSSLTSHGEEMDYEHLSGFCRGMRRRCLVFEMSGAQKQHLDENLGSDSSTLPQSDGNTSSNDKIPVATKAGNGSSCRVLPSIGLHLNALAMTPKDYKIINPESSSSGRLLIGPGLSSNFHSQSASQELINNVKPVALSEMEIGVSENTIVPMNDANEDMNQGSPKKKRRRMDSAGEGEACKRCNCKKSKCLKLYCECFAAGVYCVEPCACIDCFNKPIHEDTVLATRKQIESRNPLAFAPKVIRTSDSQAETRDEPNKTPASARHKRGCNCKKSGCLKKYCECYQGGVGCSVNCRCDGCKNVFGRKEGVETEVEEDESDTNERAMLETSLENSAINNALDQHVDCLPLATPQRFGRQSVQLPLSSNKKPPRSLPSISSSSHSRSRYFQHPNNLDKHLEMNKGDEMPEFLHGESPVSNIKLSSPSRKRVSPPHSVGMSGRKLVLQSIPPFPSLSPNL